jgi:hypothetical protein
MAAQLCGMSIAGKTSASVQRLPRTGIETPWKLARAGGLRGAFGLEPNEDNYTTISPRAPAAEFGPAEDQNPRLNGQMSSHSLTASSIRYRALRQHGASS